MKTIALPSMLGSFLALSLHATPAQAIPETWVASNGSGATCSRALPCATFAAAHTATDPGGVIKCVDAANFGGGFSITKSITIDCTGTGAGIVTVPATGNTGVVVQTAGIVVTLRGLSIDGAGIGTVGVGFDHGSALHIENCRISGFQGGSVGIGISFLPQVGTAKLHVSDSVIHNNGLPASGGGIYIKAVVSASARVVLTRVQVENNTHGIVADGTAAGSIVVQVRDSVVAGNTGNGIAATTNAALTAFVVDRTSSVGNAGNGIDAQGSGALVHIGSSTVAGNGGGLIAGGGAQILSYQNNQASGNGVEGGPTGVLTVK